jgi:hypothetical protein
MSAANGAGERVSLTTCSSQRVLLSNCRLLLLATFLTVSLAATADAADPCSSVCIGDFTCGQECLSEDKITTCGSVPPFGESCRQPFGACTEVCGDTVSCDTACNREKSGEGVTCGALSPPVCEQHQTTGSSPPPTTGGEGNIGPQALAELAQGQRAFQSSTGFGGDARRAVDGNTDGNFSHNSVTHTALQNNPEWHVQLCPGGIETITIFNRTDCCSDRLNGANLWVRRAPKFNWVHVTTLKGSLPKYVVHIGRDKGVHSELAIVLDGQARYLSLAEVSVLGFAFNPEAGCLTP